MSNQNYTTEMMSKFVLRRQHLTPKTLGRKENLTEIVRDIGGLHAQIFDSVNQKRQQGFLRSSRMVKAMLKVPREDFVQGMYRDYAYLEVPLPIPGKNATISCPHSYPMFYEALELKEEDKFLEIGAGSGYGAALAREIVGKDGRVVTMEIDRKTYEFAKNNLERTGYTDVSLILGDGTLGYPAEAPHDKICITAACPEIPKPLIRQLKLGGRLIVPVGRPEFTQNLVLLEKMQGGTFETNFIEEVLYVPLRGRYGWFKTS